MLELLSAILLMLLTMVSYSSGITLAAKRREYSPGIIDLIIVFLLWLVVFGVRSQVPRLLLVLIIIGLGVLVGAILGTVRLSKEDRAKIMPKSELPEHARDSLDTAASDRWYGRVWLRWNDFAGRMGNVQGRMLMGFFYFLIVTPFGLISRLFSDPLSMKKTPEESNWETKETTELTIEAAQEQG